MSVLFFFFFIYYYYYYFLLLIGPDGIHFSQSFSGLY